MPRSLIFLFDGTANDPTIANETPTNVFRLNQLIAEVCENNEGTFSQVSFYSPGIGTQFYASNAMAKWLQRAIGLDSVYNMALRAYVNLAANYRSGDRIVLVGFSRGAIACRMLARIISDFGILRASAVHNISDLFDLFSEAIDNPYSDYSSLAKNYREGMKEHLQEPCSIAFMGLFDCVGGPEDDREILNFLNVVDADLATNVQYCYHIMSLHDVRDHFRLWRIGIDEGKGREVWMPGVHSDVGGGYRNRDLADIALLTMARELHHHAGIALDNGEESLLRERIRIRLMDKSHFFKVNSERKILQRRYRNTYFRQNDVTHFMHVWLANKSVDWKDDGLTMYRESSDLLQCEMDTQMYIQDLLQ